MLTELRLRNQSQQLYVRALSAAWRRSTQVFNPSLWLLKDPEAEEKMLRDADIAHAIGLRRAMIAGKDWTLVPRSKNHERAEMALHVGNELVGCLKKFTESRRLLARAFFSGQRYARIHGEHRKLKIGDGRERVWYVPTRLEDVDMRMYRQVVDSDGSTGDPPSGHWERWDVYRGDWEPETIAESRQTIRHTYEDDQATLGHGRALREALGYWWYAKTHILQESLQAAERFGQGVLRARVDGARDADTDLPNTEVIREWVEALEDMRSRHVLVHDAKDDVDMVQMSGTGWQMFRELREELRNTISTLVLGATMNTTATQGGSYALAEVHENTTEALIQYDRQSLEETLTDDLIIGCLWHRNHANLRELGIDNQAPRFTITQEKALDPQVRVQVAATAAQIGLPLAKADVYEQIGFRPPEDGEDVLEPPQQPAPGGMPGGGGFPFKFRRGGEVTEAPPWTFAGEWDESKHPRDSGKFAPREGARGEPDEFEAAMADATKYARGAFRGEKDKLAAKAEMAASAIDDRYGYRVTEVIDQIENTSTDDPDAADESLSAIEDKLDALEEKIEAAIEDRVERITGKFDSQVRDSMDDRFSDQMADLGAEEEFGQLIDTVDKWADALPGHVEKVIRSASEAAGNVAHARELIAELRGEMGLGFRKSAHFAFDESKVKRDGGKFAPKEGAGQSDDEQADNRRRQAPTTADSLLPDGVTDQSSALARADAELASLPQDARDYIDGTAPMDRQPVTPAEKKQADAAIGDLGDAIAGAADAPDGTVGAVLRESLEDTADPSVKKITGQNMLKLAVGLGIMPAAAAWNVAKSYAGLVGTVLNLPGAVKGAAGALRTVWAQRGQGSWSDMASAVAGKAREAASAAAKSIRDNPVTGSLDVIGTSLIAIPFPFSMDAGLAVKGIAKAGKAFNPSQTEQSIRESIRKAFLRKRRRDRMGQFAAEPGRQRSLFAEWDESKHERAENGKFGPKKGESAPEADEAPQREKKPRKSRKKPKGLAAGEPIVLPSNWKPSEVKVDEEYAETLGEGVPAPDLYDSSSRAIASGEGYTSEKAVVPVWPDLTLPFLPRGWEPAKQINEADVEDMISVVLNYAKGNFGDDFAEFVEKRGQRIRDTKAAPKKWIEHAVFDTVANHVRLRIEKKTEEGQRDAYNANLGHGYRMEQRPTASYRILSAIDDAMKRKHQRGDQP